MLPSRGDGGSSRSGHSSVELLFASLMVAVIAAILAPKVFRNSQTQRETRTRESLTVIRDAIALYHDENMEYPPAETFAIEIAPYLNRPLPIPECLGPTRTNAVMVETREVDDRTCSADTEHGWVYSPSSGSFRLNSKLQYYRDW